MKGNGRHARAIVVGGGLAGLAAADELTNSGCDVVLLEAAAAPGGRVLSSRTASGQMVDAGGEFIGASHHCWRRLARRFGLQLGETRFYGDAAVMLDGERLSSEAIASLESELQIAYARMNVDARDVEIDAPWRHPSATTWDALSVQDWIQDLNICEASRLLLTAELETGNGVGAAQQSYLGLLTQIRGGDLERFWTDTARWYCVDGAQILATQLWSVLSPRRTMSNAAVTSIAFERNAVEITCVEGRRFTGDFVILAIPPPAWRTIRFSPALPVPFEPQMGSAAKYAASLDKVKEGVNSRGYGNGHLGTFWTTVDSRGQTAIICLSGGPAAFECASRSSPQREAWYAEELERFGVGVAGNIAATQFFDWTAADGRSGSYAFPAPNEVTGLGPVLTGAVLERLFFAGDYNDYGFVGFMEGALRSGIAAARKVIHACARRP